MKTAVKITKEARNATFEKCSIYGGVEDSGQNTFFKKTLIGLGKSPVFNKWRKVILEVILLLAAIVAILTWIGIGPLK